MKNITKIYTHDHEMTIEFLLNGEKVKSEFLIGFDYGIDGIEIVHYEDYSELTSENLLENKSFCDEAIRIIEWDLSDEIAELRIEREYDLPDEYIQWKYRKVA